MIHSIKSYAKINIALNVVKKNDDGYHDLDSVILPIELHDTIIYQILKNEQDTFVTIDDYSQGVIDYNIASIMIKKIQEEYDIDTKFRIFIHKVIPMQAGLGGGSSNAATIMKMINKVCKLNIPKEKMIKLAKEVGADVPFFVDCAPARARGIGDILTPVNVKNDYYVLLVKPEKGLSTKDIFDKSDGMKLCVSNIEDVIKALEEGDEELLANSIANSLEDPAVSLLPEIKVIKDKLLSKGLKIVGMTGSGSSVFALSSDRKLLKKIETELENKYTVILSKTLKNGGN